VRVSAPEPVLRRARRLLAGVAPGVGAVGGGDVDGLPQVAEFVAALRGRGLVVESAEVRTGPRRPLRVRVAGSNPIADLVVDLLGADVEVSSGDLDTAGVDVLVACAGWLPDAAWQALDRRCADAGVAWHMCYTDGARWFLGPMAVPGRTAGYRDTRARRLAACGVAAEVLAHWAFLDSDVDVPPVRWPPTAPAAVLAGLLATDVLAYRSSGVPATDGFQLAVDPATGVVTRHPVLPLPAAARPGGS